LSTLSDSSKVQGARNCDSPTVSCKFTTEEITGAQNFNFAHKFLQIGNYLAPKLVHLETFSKRTFWQQSGQNCTLFGTSRECLAHLLL